MPFLNTSNVQPRYPLPGWEGRFVQSDNMTFVYWDIEEGAQSIHEHHHIQEEVWHVLEGSIEVTINGVTQTAGPGSVAVIPSNTPHSARVIGACRVLVADHPSREPFGKTTRD